MYYRPNPRHHGRLRSRRDQRWARSGTRLGLQAFLLLSFTFVAVDRPTGEVRQAFGAPSAGTGGSFCDPGITRRWAATIIIMTASGTMTIAPKTWGTGRLAD